MLTRCSIVAATALAAAAFAQTPATTPASQAASSPASAPTPLQNPAALIERKLASEIEDLHWQNVPLSQAVDNLARSTRTNLVVNWAALAQIGIPRDMPISFRARKVPYELILSTLLDSLATDKGRLNYAVSQDGGGLIEVSTIADFSKRPTINISSVRRLLDQAFEARPAPSENVALLTKLFDDELASFGEPESARKVRIEPAGGRLVVLGSDRAHAIVQRTLATLLNPVRAPQVPARAALTPRGKAAEDRLKQKIHAELKPRSLDDVALYLADVGKQPMLVMPNAAPPDAVVPAIPPQEETLGQVLSKVLGSYQPPLTYEINALGVVVIAAPAQLAQHDVLAAYDVRAQLQLAAKQKRAVPATAPALGELLARSVAGRMGSEPRRGAWFYHGTLVIRGSPAQIRELAPQLATQFDSFLK